MSTNAQNFGPQTSEQSTNGYPTTLDDFERVIMSGSDVNTIPQALKESLRKALKLRQYYMNKSCQPFCRTTAKFIGSLESISSEPLVCDERPIISDPSKGKRPMNCNYTIRMERGIVSVFNKKGIEMPFGGNISPIDRFYKFIDDVKSMCDIINDGPIKTFSYQRLAYLTYKFKIHSLVNGAKEDKQQKEILHRDFYNVRKVDNHIHSASSMNQKHLLRFMKKTVKNNRDDKVCVEHGNSITLEKVFESLNVSTYDLSVDMLDVHSNRETFHRFDKFNTKYNPIGESRLRELFLKTDNQINGKYFASLIKEVMNDLETNKYSSSELRISIYGRKPDEWYKLADWALINNVYSDTVRWIIQIPRLYDVYHENKLVSNFEQILKNIFLPLFEATNSPEEYPALALFLQYVIGFDSVDDESKSENPFFEKEIALPDNWTDKENPSYNYYLYFMYENLSVLNNFRHKYGLNTFVLRPHCGEAGPTSHLIGGFLLSDSIAHGLILRKVPVLQYLYYLSQIGISMSPISNNSLFLDYRRNPMPEFLCRGLCVTLSTDDPLQFHYTREPLMEEYSIATQFWKLSSCDMCEMARNSVLMSGFPHYFKQRWIGRNYRLEGMSGNDFHKTNVPQIRIQYRYETLTYELNNIFKI